MPIAHKLADDAIARYSLTNNTFTNEPDETVCAECLFFAWFEREPIDPPDTLNQFTHYRPGSRNPAWDELLSHSVYRQALGLMQKGIATAYADEMKRVA